MRRKYYRIFLIVLLVIVVAGGIWYYNLQLQQVAELDGTFVEAPLEREAGETFAEKQAENGSAAALGESGCGEQVS